MENWKEKLKEIIDSNGRIEDLEDIEILYEDLEPFISQELSKAREDTYKDLVETFGYLKKDDLVNKSFILAIIKEELSKLKQ